MLENENKLAAASTITQEEIAMLFQGERRDRMYSARDSLWSESIRQAYRQMRMED